MYQTVQMAVVIRPHIKYFFERVTKFAELFIYTHSERKYAESLLDLFVDPEKNYIPRKNLFTIQKGYDQSRIKKKLIK